MQDLHNTIYLPRAEARSPSGRRQPIPDRTLGAQGQRPGGAINPRPRKRASTFGNTGKHRSDPGPDPDRATGSLFHKLSHVPVDFSGYHLLGVPVSVDAVHGQFSRHDGVVCKGSGRIYMGLCADPAVHGVH